MEKRHRWAKRDFASVSFCSSPFIEEFKSLLKLASASRNTGFLGNNDTSNSMFRDSEGGARVTRNFEKYFRSEIVNDIFFWGGGGLGSCKSIHLYFKFLTPDRRLVFNSSV